MCVLHQASPKSLQGTKERLNLLNSISRVSEHMKEGDQISQNALCKVFFFFSLLPVKSFNFSQKPVKVPAEVLDEELRTG